MDTRRIAPVPDRDSAHYWAALARGALELQRCRDCGHWTWPPRPICSGCHGESLAWEPVKGTGEVYSWVVSHRAYTPDFSALVPYTIALVRIDEQDDILIPGRLLSEAAVYQGLRVRAAPEPLTDEVGVLNWAAETEP
jgi:uncharacterized OB-fold protein